MIKKDNVIKKVLYLFLVQNIKKAEKLFSLNLFKYLFKLKSNLFFLLCDRSANLICPGRTKKHSKKLATITLITTKGIASIICPITPDIRNTGAKPAIVVNDAAVTGPNILIAPV